MPQAVQIGDKRVGTGQPVYIVAEIGINHNGDIDIAKIFDRCCSQGWL